MLHLIITIFLGIFLVFTSIMLFYALKRINNYEKIILNISNIVDIIKHQLKIIDEKGHFEADDEIGFFFEDIKKLSNELEQLFEIEVDNGNSKEKKEEE